MKKKPSNRKFAIIVALVIFLPLVTIMGFVLPPYTYGKDGSLSLTVGLDRTTLSVAETMNVTVSMQNTGSTKLRIDYGDSDNMYESNFHIEVYNHMGDKVGSHLPRLALASRAPSSFSSYNIRLRELAPGESLKWTTTICNYTEQRHFGWDVQPGESYTVVGMFDSSDTRGFPVHPHWNGNVASVPKQFTVTS